jgi:hypothetical protein
VHQQFGRLWGPIFISFYFQQSEMVQMHSHPPPLEVQPSAAVGASNNQDLTDFMKRMIESLEALKKQNKYLNTRLTMAEAHNNRRDREREERRERERQKHSQRQANDES